MSEYLDGSQGIDVVIVRFVIMDKVCTVHTSGNSKGILLNPKTKRKKDKTPQDAETMPPPPPPSLSLLLPYETHLTWELGTNFEFWTKKKKKESLHVRSGNKNTTSNLLMSVWLICRRSLSYILHWHARLWVRAVLITGRRVLLVRRIPPKGTFDAGVLVGRLPLLGGLVAAIFLIVALDAVAAAGAAAGAEQPKGAGRPGAEHRDPHDDVHGITEGGVDVVVFEGGVEGSHQRAVEDRSRQGEGEDEEAADGRYDRRG